MRGGNRLHKAGVTIRPCRAEDEATYVAMNLAFMALVREEHAAWDEFPMPTAAELGVFFRQALVGQADGLRMFMVEDKDPIGFVNTWTVYSIWAMGKTLIIDDLFLVADRRGRGGGQQALNALLEYAQGQCYRRVQLAALQDNPVAQHVYRKCGFSETEQVFFLKRI